MRGLSSDRRIIPKCPAAEIIIDLPEGQNIL
jgi:hypothetical protein